jgi:hypothetical protein
LEQALKVINRMKDEGIVRDYAVGGAVALLFYAEAVLTYDLDVFCRLPGTHSSLVSLAPIFEWLKSRGYREDKEHMVIEGLPVQFIPAYNSLVEEAVECAEERTFKGVPIRVVQMPHLIAIMIQTGRNKDKNDWSDCAMRSTSTNRNCCRYLSGMD